MRSIGLYIAVIMLFVASCLASCKKTKVLSNGGTLKFSVDTLMFDTVFTNAGSFTTGLKIFNPQNEEVILSSVKLQGGASSYFHLNVDGFPGNNIPNIKIAAHDSIYVFATVNIDPTNVNSPFIVEDELIATLNGNEFKVPFTAYGQNANYVTDSVLRGAITWDTGKPYVVVGYAALATSCTLTINAGVRVYMHQNAGMLVYGALHINGTADDTVIFQGDRLDRAYFGYIGYPGEWGSIYFNSNSSGNRLSYTRLENCGNGAMSPYLGSPFNIYAAAIQVDRDSTGGGFTTPQLSLDHCIIENSISHGLLSYQGTVLANNTLINTCGGQTLAISQGGNDSFVNCTFANYGSAAVSHTDNPAVLLLNYYQDPNTELFTYGDMNVAIVNCIVYGSLDSEFIADALSSAAARVNLNHCLIKSGNVLENFVQTILPYINADPQFTDQTKADFHIPATSPAVGQGITTTLTNDLEGTTRTTPPDIGCYQHKP